MTAKLFYKVGFFSLLTVILGVGSLLVYDLGFNDSKITTNTLAKAEALTKELIEKASNKVGDTGQLKSILDTTNTDNVRDPIERLKDELGIEDTDNTDPNTISFSNSNSRSIVSEFPIGTFGFNVDASEQASVRSSFNKAWSLKKEFKVTSVADGDTIRGYYVSDPKKTSQSIRITSIDTPESTSLTKPNVWQKTWGKRATDFAKNIFLNKETPDRKVYILETPETSHGRVVGSVWYSDVPASGHVEISSYAHEVVGAGLAIPARLKTQAYYSLDEGGGENSGKGEFETYFETVLNTRFTSAAKNGYGFWTLSKDEDTIANTNSDNGEDYSTIQGWYDIFDNKYDYLDVNLPDTMDSSVSLEKMATIIEYYVYPSITWWKSDDLTKRGTGNYCTLDTITKHSLETGETGTFCPSITF